jgi:DNA-directed RNA polymerase specialized sigma24 family protein
MDARSRPSKVEQPNAGQLGAGVLASTAGAGAERTLASERVGQTLGEWQARELRVARGFAECRGLSTEQLEDIYQETALALYSRPYQSEEHLLNALRMGVKHRALRLHRDERRRGQILAHSAPGLHLMAQAREGQSAPEPAVLAKEDRLIALEFKTELTAEEQRVFGWLAEGLQYRAVASVLGIPVNQARNTARSCARKRERFQLLYDTGRLCGYRARTIQALQNGEATSEVLAERAFAHLDSCSRCCAEHKTNAKRLRRRFRDQAAALLPPVLGGHLGWLAKLGLRARTLQHRLASGGVPLGQGGVRERAAALLAGGGVGVKVATGVVTVAVLAGGALATHVLDHPPAPARQHAAPSTAATPRTNAPAAQLISASPAPSLRTSIHRTVHTSRRPRRSSPGRVLAGTDRASGPSAGTQREPGGFAYLGVPTGTSALASAPEQAHTAARGSGGPFSP